MLEEIIERSGRVFDQALDEGAPPFVSREVGQVVEYGRGIARISGLPSLKSEELVEFPGGLLGMAINLDPDDAGVILLGESDALSAGVEVRATGRLADTPVGEGLLGRVVDATGQALDGQGTVEFSERRPIERPAPAILDRAPVATPLQTGLKSVDALIPIGRGQRELIVGDRQTGKTTIAVDTIINQQGKDVVCIYCAIGQRGTAVARVVETLRRHGAMDYTTVMVAAGEAPPGLRFITPYAATSLGEYFMEQGRDVLLVFDDLTRHARSYRELSLLLRRPPGREAYPGDIFYIHSRMLERATHLSGDLGGGSLTALPIVETQAQDISAYIPTNLISITDGQIYVSPELFRKGVMPAVDIGRSVSRVGGKAQFPAYREVAGDLRLAYSQFEDLETFARFATRLDEETRKTIERGRRVREVLKQDEHQPLSAAAQVAILKTVNAGLFDGVALEQIGRLQHAVAAAVTDQLPQICDHIEAGKKLPDDEWREMMQVIEATLDGDGHGKR